jgi:Fe2+ or Zn2+ uptake regulation protein
MRAADTHNKGPIEAEQLRQIFAHHGLRTTRQRESVYRALAGCRDHPTAEQLLALVHMTDPEVSQATIYNTLDTLVDCGLANRLPATTNGGACRYDADTGEHVHMVLDDGRILDVPQDLSDRLIRSVPSDLLEELANRLGVTCSGIKIELSGS